MLGTIEQIEGSREEGSLSFPLCHVRSTLSGLTAYFHDFLCTCVVALFDAGGSGSREQHDLVSLS